MPSDAAKANTSLSSTVPSSTYVSNEKVKSSSDVSPSYLFSNCFISLSWNVYTFDTFLVASKISCLVVKSLGRITLSKLVFILLSSIPKLNNSVLTEFKLSSVPS